MTSEMDIIRQRNAAMQNEPALIARLRELKKMGESPLLPTDEGEALLSLYNWLHSEDVAEVIEGARLPLSIYSIEENTANILTAIRNHMKGILES